MPQGEWIHVPINRTDVDSHRVQIGYPRRNRRAGGRRAVDVEPDPAKEKGGKDEGDE